MPGVNIENIAGLKNCFDYDEKIGSGKFGSVFKVYDKSSGDSHNNKINNLPRSIDLDTVCWSKSFRHF